MSSTHSDVPALEITNLTKKYSNGVEALKGLNLTVQSGDFYALLGPNGAGKSTTIGIVTSLVNKSSGDVKIFGYDLATDVVNAKRQIGLVPQEFNFNPFETCFQIVANQGGYYGLPRQLAKERAEKYLKLLNLWDKRNSRARMLSGGMKRRLMIARALVHEPKLLILDEPTAGVDIELRRSMWDFLRQINGQGMTIILTTHYLEEAEMLCRNIGIIQSGELIANTSMKQLLAKSTLGALVFEYEPIEKEVHLPNQMIMHSEPGLIEVEINHDVGINQLLTELTQQGVTIISVHNKTNRLEELFIHLVENANKDKQGESHE